MLICVLGGGIDLKGRLPDRVYKRLDKAIEIYNKNPDAKIVLSGKYSYLYIHKPLLFESEAMKKYLLIKNIPEKDILLEKKSKDTIGNAYYLKKLIFLPHQEHKAVIITSAYHLTRANYIFKKIFGKGYHFSFAGTKDEMPEDEKKLVLKRQQDLLLKTKQILSKMKDGDHDFLKRKIYNLKYYRGPHPDWVRKFVEKGK